MHKSHWLLAGLLGLVALTGCTRAESISTTIPASKAPPTETPLPTAIIAPTPQWTVVPIAPTHAAPTDVPTSPAPPPVDPAWQDQVAQAKEDLAQRLSLDVSQIELVEVQPTVWPDGSLGCPQPGMAYIQVQQDGLLIRLRAGKVTYNYHSGGNRGPFLCEKRARGDDPLPPPGSGSP